MTRAFAPLLAVAGCVGVWVWLPAPFFWIALILAGLLLWAMKWSRRPALRAACFNLYLLSLGIAAIEGYLLVRELSRLRDEPRYYEGYYQPHDLLGYAPRPGMRTPATRHHDGEVVYDVVYTIGSDGLRRGPPLPAAEARGCALFFGGSFTFGEGVGDAETLPHQFEVATGGRTAARNFGFHGYGPHQMLAALESGWADAAARCPPTLAVYQGMVPHIPRAAGRSAWDRSGPRYDLDGRGGVVRRGSFGEAGSAGEWLRTALRRSGIVRGLADRRVADADVDRYVAIVVAARDRFESGAPGREFHVVFWDQPGDPTSDRVVSALRGAGVRVHPVTRILPEVESVEFGAHGLGIRTRDGGGDAAGYTLSPHDGHPSAAVYARIARFLADAVPAP